MAELTTASSSSSSSLPLVAESDFLAGVIEGFYGPPWTRAERFELFDWMEAAGLNTYMYGPKDDLHHRNLWRETYPPAEAEALRELILACRQRGFRFLYAMGPGLDIRYGNPADRQSLRARLAQLLALGADNFALLFDDIPDRLDAADIARWGSLAAAQADLVNEMYAWSREQSAHGRFLFCPTPYCGRMAERRHGGPDYLAILGRELRPEIDIFWTGPEIISSEITVAHLEELTALLRRRPVLWDNLHANDYDGRRFYCGPYSGRTREVKAHLRGILTNPNCEFPLNFVPLRTLADFVKGEGPWVPREAYLAAMKEWRSRFATPRQEAAFDDLVLFGDCFYLPLEDGASAAPLIALLRDALRGDREAVRASAAAFRDASRRLREFCGRLAELRDRPLFYALHRRVWELREELDLLERCLEARFDVTPPNPVWRSDFHLPGTYRGSFVARLQQLLSQNPDGTFRPKP